MVYKSEIIFIRDGLFSSLVIHMKENKRENMTDNSASKIPSEIRKVEKIPSEIAYKLRKGDRVKVIAVDTYWTKLRRWDREEKALVVKLMLRSLNPEDFGKTKLIKLYYPLESTVGENGKAGAFLLGFFEKFKDWERARNPEEWIGYVVEILEWEDGKNKVKVHPYSELSVVITDENLIKQVVEKDIKLEKKTAEDWNLGVVEIGRDLAELLERRAQPGSKFFGKSNREVFEEISKLYREKTGVDKDWRTYKYYHYLYTRLLMLETMFRENAKLDPDREELLYELACCLSQKLFEPNPLAKYYKVLGNYCGRLTVWEIADFLEQALKEKWTPRRLEIEFKRKARKRRSSPLLYSILGKEVNYKDDLENEDGLAEFFPVFSTELAVLYRFGLIDKEVLDKHLERLRKRGKEEMVKAVQEDIEKKDKRILVHWLSELFWRIRDLLGDLEELDVVETLKIIKEFKAEFSDLERSVSPLVEELAETEVN